MPATPPAPKARAPALVPEETLREIFLFSASGPLLRYYPPYPETRRHADALTSILKAVDIFTHRIYESDLGELRSIAFARFTMGIVRGHHLTVAYIVNGRDVERWIVPLFGALTRVEMRHRAALRAEALPDPEALRSMDEAFQPLLGLA